MSGAHWEIVFDGGSKGNPGLGYGSFRLRRAGGAWEPACERLYGDEVTNNEAEYQTLTEALRTLAERVGDPASTTVTIRGDSKLVLEQLAGNWKVRAANLRAFHADAKAELERFGETHLVWQGRDKSVELLGH